MLTRRPAVLLIDILLCLCRRGEEEAATPHLRRRIHTSPRCSTRTPCLLAYHPLHVLPSAPLFVMHRLQVLYKSKSVFLVASVLVLAACNGRFDGDVPDGPLAFVLHRHNHGQRHRCVLGYPLCDRRCDWRRCRSHGSTCFASILRDRTTSNEFLSSAMLPSLTLPPSRLRCLVATFGVAPPPMAL